MTVLRASLDLNTGKFDTKLSNATGTAKKGASKIGKAFKAGLKASGAAIAGIGVASVKMAADFEKSFAEVATLFDKQTAKQLPALKKQILALGPELGNATELTQGLYQAISAGTEPAKAVQFVAQSAKLAKAGLADMDSVVKVLAGNVNAYGKESLSSAQVSDLLFNTVKSGVVQLPELASSLGQVSGTAADAGVSQKELFAAIAQITKAGVPTSQAITGIKAAISNIIKPSKQAAELADKLKVGFDATALKSKGLSGILADLSKATGGNTEQMAQFFGSVEGLNAALALSKEGAGLFKEEIAGMGAAAAQNGAVTEEAFRKQAATLNNQLAAVTNSINLIGIKLGNEFLPQVKGVTDLILKNIDLITKAANIAMAPIRALVGVSSALGETAGTVAAIGTAAITGKGGGVGAVLTKAGEARQATVTGGALGGALTSGGFSGALASGLQGLFGSSTVPKRAAGGPVAAGQTVTVGEKGPEAFRPATRGTILPGSSGIAGGGFESGSDDLGAKVRAFWTNVAASGTKAGLVKGTKDAAGKAKGKGAGGVAGTLFKATMGGSLEGAVSGLLSGDTSKASDLFSKETGKKLGDAVKKHLIAVLGKKLLGGVLGGFGGSIAGFAAGGTTPGGPVLVGERGPEVLIPPRGSRVLPNGLTEQMGGGVTLSIGEMNIRGADATEEGGRSFTRGMLLELRDTFETGEAPELARAIVEAGS